MKNKLTRILGVFMILGIVAHAQKNDLQQAEAYLSLKGEVIFTIPIQTPLELPALSKEVSIVHYDERTQTAKLMANRVQFKRFLQRKRSFTVTEADNIIGYRTMTSDLAVKATTFPLAAYPTYADYTAMMSDFVAKYPDICSLQSIGATTEGDKEILFVKLSDNVAADEQEPRVMYTSSMHGDEIAGYPMMLNLIDLLLTAYTNPSDPRHASIKALLDNNEIWINPLANPDGTYRNSASNTSVANATRGNANNVDLNRNYPDPDDGANPDGNAYQIETQHFMNLAAEKHFVLSANFHGGIELINYPWDTYGGAHPDTDYFIYISEEYRDLCQENSPNGYFDARNNGITNGFDWYEVQGGRQDYQIYYHKGREVTVELSNAKTPAANQLVNYWNYNTEALLRFLEQVNYGIRGVVTDAVTNQPIDAKVTVVGKESFETWTPTELPEGDYYRPIKAGTYTLVYEAPCYETKTITGVSISDYQTVVQNVALTPVSGIAPSGLTTTSVQATTATINWQQSTGTTYGFRYRVVGSTDWIGLSVATNTTTLTGLVALTAYEVQVRSECAGTVGSPYSESVTFTTTAVPACEGIAAFPYTEGFESGLGVWDNATNDTIDWTRNSNGTPSNATGPDGAQQGTFYLYTEASGNGTGYPQKEAILESPCIDLTTFSGASLSFYYHMQGNNMGSLSVLASTDDGATYTTIWDKVGAQGSDWQLAEIDLSAYAGAVVTVQIKGVTGNGFRSDIAIDNIRLESVGSDDQSPTAPTNLVATNTTGSATTLSWTAATDNIGVTAYNIYEGGTLINTATTTTVTISGLTPNTTYRFTVEALDAAGNTSVASDEVIVTTTDSVLVYCDSQGTTVSDEYIDYVGIGNIDNASTATTGYVDYTNLSTAVAYGENTITLSLAYGSTVYTEYWNVWIDFDQNGTFETTELVVSEFTRSDALQSYMFEIPTTAVAGATRMRVSLKYNAVATPCETFRYGEVEDYILVIGTDAKDSVLQKKVTRTIGSDIRLYPNPVKEGVLFVSGIKDTQSTLAIYNYMGQQVWQSTGQLTRIDVSHLAKGMYILEVANASDKVLQGFVIQ